MVFCDIVMMMYYRRINMMMMMMVINLINLYFQIFSLLLAMGFKALLKYF